MYMPGRYPYARVHTCNQCGSTYLCRLGPKHVFLLTRTRLSSDLLFILCQLRRAQCSPILKHKVSHSGLAPTSSSIQSNHSHSHGNEMRTKLHLLASVAGSASLHPHLNQTLSLNTLKSFILIFIAISIARAVYKFWIYPNHVSPLRHLPGPRDHHFLLGQAVNQFRSGNPNEPYTSWMRTWPDANLIRFTTFGNAEAVLVTGLEAWRDILSVKPYSFVKPAIFKRLIGPIVGKGLVFSEGDEHKVLRKLLAGTII